ncbi:MAG: asparaginase [Micrococcales bacterium]|nr:MAG: asparaginase [Micrococcales bacterium]
MGAPAQPDVASNVGLLARVIRNDLVDSAHLGHLVVLGAGGETLLQIGDPDQVFLPRSALKPLQVVAMLRAGLQLPPDLVALAASSHSGESAHLDGVWRMLSRAGLSEFYLHNTPALPRNADAARAWRRHGRGPEAITQECSGKHAAMLVTTTTNGWDLGRYLAPNHPVQRAVRDTVVDLTGDDTGLVAVDGCGAPLFAVTLSGLARAYGRIAAAPGTDPKSPLAKVATGMTGHPFMVGGTGRLATGLMSRLPGILAKDGAEGVLAIGLPDGRAIACKVLDGSPRPLAAVVVAALRAIGVRTAPVADLADTPVLGHGKPVGRVIPVFLPAPGPGHRLVP